MGVVSKRIRNNDGRMNLPLLTISARYGWMTQQNRFSANIAGSEKKNYTLLKKHQLSYNHGNSKAAIYGTVFELTNYDEALVPKVYHSFSIICPNSSKFIESYFHTKKLDKQLRKFIASTARMDGLLNISFDDFMKVALFMPNQYEQSKISKIINLIEKLITLQQRKLEQLELLEKALQQKLFPRNSQKKPLLQYLNSDNSWWNSCIGEIFSERVDKGSSKKLLSVSIANGVYPFDESKRKNNSSDDKHNYKKVFQNDIAYNSMRLWQGALGVSKYEGIVSPAYTVLKPLANQNSNFYEFMFKNADMLHVFQRNSQGLTSDTWNLKFNQLQRIKVKTTNLASQNKIAQLLIKTKQLRDHEFKCHNDIMNFKKYLLQKLFI